MLMPFLGAGVNRANRPPGVIFEPGGPYLPDAGELSGSIADEFHYPHGWDDRSLLRVSWYASESESGGKDRLYKHLHSVFGGKYPSTDVHRFFAALPGRFRNSGYNVPPQIIVTTNYDRVLEDAFDEKGEPYDVYAYDVQNEDQVGKFEHTPHGGTPRIVDDPVNYDAPIEHTVILKIHGAVARTWERSTFVITEDDYIDYAALFNPEHIPSLLKEKMLPRRFLYLGYSLSDWNLRVLLRGISHRSRFRGQKTWAIMNKHEPWDPMYWDKHGVRLIQLSLTSYIEILNEHLQRMFDQGP